MVFISYDDELLLLPLALPLDPQKSHLPQIQKNHFPNFHTFSCI